MENIFPKLSTRICFSWETGICSSVGMRSDYVCVSLVLKRERGYPVFFSLTLDLNRPMIFP